jgi:uncharacterized protein (DUF362 family)
MPSLGAQSRCECGRNVIAVLLLLATLLTAAICEHYLQRSLLPLALWLALGFGFALWLALRISSARLFALLLIIFLVEYAKESIGVRSQLWAYTGTGGRYVFGVLGWVVAGTAVYAIATGVTIPLLRRLHFAPPRWLNLAIVLALAALVALLLGPYRALVGLSFWSFYALTVAVGLLAVRRMPFPVLAGVVLTAWVVALPSEYLGSVLGRAWIFHGDPRLPPLYLLLGGWPLEILAQYALSAFLAGEPVAGEAAPAVPEPEGLARDERILRAFLVASGIVYLVVGFAFALVPGAILGALNRISQLVLPSLPVPGLPVDRFWVALAFSMMMTITALSFIAAFDVRGKRGYMLPVLIAKLASAVAGLLYFVLFAHHLASLAIFLVDGALFCLTAFLLVRAQRGFFREQTGFYYGEAGPPTAGPPTTVAAVAGEDKLDCLKRVLDQTHFDEVLERRWAASGKTREAFSVVIKPNFMFMHALADRSTYTDPALVHGLIERILALGFRRIFVVEAQSTYGNYYAQRDVRTVAEYVGYQSDGRYRIVDLTEERVPYDYGAKLGQHWVGPTWRDADFRISFAKNKTHVFCNYTLTLKNVYGTLPMQDKLREYHTEREYDWPTIESMKHFPVHFGLIDAFLSGDGQFGVITCPKPKPTKTIIGGESLIAVDWVGAKKMGLDPDDPRVGRFLPLAVQAFGRPEIHWMGDTSTYPRWHNVWRWLICALDLIEEGYAFSNWWFSVLTAMDAKFPFLPKHWATRAMRKLLAPGKRYFYPHDVL